MLVMTNSILITLVFFIAKYWRVASLMDHGKFEVIWWIKYELAPNFGAKYIMKFVT